MSPNTNHSSLSTFFNATSIAVIGASREPAKVGNQILKNLSLNTSLKLFPINPRARRILGHDCYSSIIDVPQPVEVAVIVVPIQFVQSVVEECIVKRVKAIVMITAGFAEFSKAGKKLQQDIIDSLKEHHIALLGPNTLGLLAPHKKLNMSFASKEIQTGSLGLISQSGAMLTALFDEMSSREVGCSFAVSLGNKAGITENDALLYAANDPHTKTLGLYLESFSDLPNFFELASEISKTKPIIILKGGRSKHGQQASISHTAALATNYELLKIAQHQAGFVLVDTIEEFIQSLFFLEKHRTVPTNVMIMTNAGGPGVNTTDVVSSKNVTLAKWTEGSSTAIHEEFPLVHPSNPLDLLGDARTDRFQFALKQAQRDPNIDSIMIILTQQAVTDIPAIITMICEQKGKKPILVALIGGPKLEKYRQQLRTHNITAASYPNQLVDILSIIHKVDTAKYISSTFKQLSPPTTHNLPPTTNFPYTIDQAFKLLNEYGFQTPRYTVARTPQDIKHYVYPLYCKTANLTLKHKKKIGAVAGMVENDQEAKTGYTQMAKFGNDVLYQELVQANGEFLLGAIRDPQFGLYIAFGLGGSNTDLMQDRAYIFPPANTEQILTQLKTTKAYELIKHLEEQNGDKGSVDQFIKHIKNLQKLLKEHPEIKEIEINPFMVNPQGFWAADVKVSV